MNNLHLLATLAVAAWFIRDMINFVVDTCYDLSSNKQKLRLIIVSFLLLILVGAL